MAKNVIYVKNWSIKTKNIDIKIYLANMLNIQDISILNLSGFSIKIVNDSHPLMDKVKELRQKVFQKSGDKESDSDEFDKFCDHLVVIDKSISKDFVVGTYRLLLKTKVYKKSKIL